jgi:deazaflavin-dependent oxidoreductase (nitroreductase family)
MTTAATTTRGPDLGANTLGDRPLPYGPFLTRALPLVQRAFLGVNRYAAVPLLRAGLGPLFATPLTGSLMVLRTRGRRSGRWRDAPLGYVILDGSVYCTAGFGRPTQWFRNIEADPRVELLLPAGALAGTAEEVTEPIEWTRAMRALLTSLGLISRATLGDVRPMSDEGLRAHVGALPLVRIQVTGLRRGPFDPGGRGWVVPALVCAVWLAGWASRRVGRQRR